MYPDIFEDASFFLSFGFLSTHRRLFRPSKQRFPKTVSRVDNLEDAVFLFFCGQMEVEIFKNTIVIASIHHLSGHALGLRESRKSILFISFLSSKSSTVVSRI